MVGSIGVGGAANANGTQGTAPPPPAPAPVQLPSTYDVPLRVPGDAEPCTSCGRAELERAYEVQAMEQGSVDARVLQQVAAAYAASRPAA